LKGKNTGRRKQGEAELEEQNPKNTPRKGKTEEGKANQARIERQKHRKKRRDKE